MCQNIPNDPVMLLSFVNTQLRDYFTTLDLFCENFNVDRRVELEEQPREALLLGEALAAGDVVEHSAQSGHYPDVAAPVLQAGLQAVRVGVGRVMVGVDRVDDALRVGEEIDRQLFRAGVIAAEVV